MERRKPKRVRDKGSGVLPRTQTLPAWTDTLLGVDYGCTPAPLLEQNIVWIAAGIHRSSS
jgi:hypothetical protein